MSNTRTPTGGAEAHYLAAINRHGVVSDVALITLQIAKQLRTQMMKGHKRARKEWAAMLDFRTGQEHGPRCNGVEDQVDITEQLNAAGEREVISIHTHPGSSSFSSRDAEVLLANPTIRVLVVIGSDRTLYVLSRDPASGVDHALARYQVENTYESQAMALASAYRSLRLAGYMTRAEAWRAHSHEIWEKIKTALGLLYDRVEASPSMVSPRL